MDMMFSSVNNYVKNMDMQMKWQNKKATGNYTPDGKKSMSQWVSDQQNKLSENEDKKANDKTLKSINEKLSRGERLSYSERQYLKKKDPQSYKKLTDMEAEQAEYERKLRQCRTKDEVQKLKMQRVSASVAKVNSVKNNPHITPEKKLEIIAEEQRRNAASERTEIEFARRGEYGALPTEAERIAAEKKLAEAKQNEQQAASEEKTEIKPEIKVETKPAMADIEGKEVKKAAEVKTTVTEKKTYTVKKRGITKAQAEMSYEVRKTKKAKAKSNHIAGTSGTAAEAAGTAVKTLDVKA